MHDIDDYDKQILKLLRQNGRLTNQELGELVGLSASQISRRRIQLEQQKYIIGYSARISPAALNLDISSVLEITLAEASPEAVTAFYELVKHTPAILDMYKTTGNADFILKVAVAELSDLSALISDLAAHKTVGHIRTAVVLERLKEDGVWL
ncbi:Lrp/AsnC family transcriptional regulator [Alteromonas oceani]|uniref:Lrp/AsnC family transcriptional regulator n=1 Tax=Alteromonas oceani TaxID=2071609 RepID=A0ABV7JZS5_9ALTE|nr:Lrp/AsnC family transcriptional regulator [Alteromonas oceani]MCP4864839.1 Lrp/AsnC family transcriptional regulator [Alteromonas sp.]